MPTLLERRQLITDRADDIRRERNLIGRGFRDANRLARRSGNPRHARTALQFLDEGRARGFNTGQISSFEGTQAFAREQLRDEASTDLARRRALAQAVRPSQTVGEDPNDPNAGLKSGRQILVKSGRGHRVIDNPNFSPATTSSPQPPGGSPTSPSSPGGPSGSQTLPNAGATNISANQGDGSVPRGGGVSTGPISFNNPGGTSGTFSVPPSGKSISSGQPAALPSGQPPAQPRSVGLRASGPARIGSILNPFVRNAEGKFVLKSDPFGGDAPIPTAKDTTPRIGPASNPFVRDAEGNFVPQDSLSPPEPAGPTDEELEQLASGPGGTFGFPQEVINRIRSRPELDLEATAREFEEAIKNANPFRDRTMESSFSFAPPGSFTPSVRQRRGRRQ